MAGFQLQRLGIVMEPEPGNLQELEGVLNPAAVRGPDGELYLFPRLVARGNYSRIGIARVKFNAAGEAQSVIGFVQQLASNYLPHGYWFYVTGVIPEGKDPRDVDCKLIAKYGIELSRQARCRRKLGGRANLHYLRHERFFILLATHGQHVFFTAEGDRIRDARKTPIHFAGYSLSVTRGHFLEKDEGTEHPIPDTKLRVRVRISRETIRNLEGYFLEIAPRRSAEALSAQLFNVPFEPYAPVRKQLLNLLRLVNQARQSAGLEKLRSTVLRYRREIIRPFAPLGRDRHLTESGGRTLVNYFANPVASRPTKSHKARTSASRTTSRCPVE